MLFFGLGGNFTDPVQEKGREAFVRNGCGVVGIHATDAFIESVIDI